MPYKTLGELRATVLARVGMGGMGASGGANQALVDSWLQNGQKQLYEATDWRHLTTYTDIATGVGQTLYDYPEACARDTRVLRIEVQFGGQWKKLTEGITTGMQATVSSRSVPARYERYAQIHIYPESDAAYALRVWYVADLARFTQAEDRASLDDDMILLHATANAKAHYRQPDAKTYQDQLEALLARIKGRSFGSNGVYRRDDGRAPEPRPSVVGRD